MTDFKFLPKLIMLISLRAVTMHDNVYWIHSNIFLSFFSQLFGNCKLYQMFLIKHKGNKLKTKVSTIFLIKYLLSENVSKYISYLWFFIFFRIISTTKLLKSITLSFLIPAWWVPVLTYSSTFTAQTQSFIFSVLCV